MCGRFVQTPTRRSTPANSIWTPCARPSHAKTSRRRSRWEGFKERYFTELDAKHEALCALAETSRGGRPNLLSAASDPVHNTAVALHEYLLQASKMAWEAIGEEPE